MKGNIMKLTKFSLIIFLLFLGCNDSNVNPIENGLELTINKTSFDIDEPIVSILLNKNIYSAFLYHCNFQFIPEIEKKEIDSWISFSSPICLALYKSGITEFEAGKESKETLNINKPGTYRLKFSYSFSNRNSLDNLLYSKEFSVK
jgi:hypothetical protein